MNPIEPEPPLMVADAKAVRFLQDNNRSRYLLPFVARACNIKQAADDVGVGVGLLGYWVHRMLELGLIRLEHTESRKGSPIKFYRSVADTIIVPMRESTLEQDIMLLQGQFGGLWQRLLRSSVLTAKRLTPEWQVRYFRDEYGQAQVSVEPHENLEALGVAWRQPLNHWNFLQLHPDEAKALRAELDALLRRYNQRPNEPGLEPYLMHVGLVRDFGLES